MMIESFDDARRAVADGATPEAAAAELVATMTPEERLWCLDGDAPTWAGLLFLGQDGYHKAPFAAAEVERVGLPGIRFSDGPRGAVVGNATCFPVSMARGATWDPELEERIGTAIGAELRALGATLTGAVCVNVLRHPAWGRAQETYGEDPHAVGELGAAFTRGLQRHVMACVKHFACNSMENARFSVDIEVDEQALHEVYLPHFRRIVDEGVASVMSAYNSVNGEWAGQNHALLTDVLRDEWGFTGFVISDWIFGLRDAATSVTAGLDIEMPYRMVRYQHLPEALERGDASWDDVDRAVGHVLATLLRFDPVLSAPPPAASVVGSVEHRTLAREAAARSVVLLRNEDVDGSPVLPLPASSRVAVIGPLADVVNLGDAGSSDVWDLRCATVLDGVRGATTGVVFDDGSEPARAAEVAAGADAAIVVVGYTYLDEGEFIGQTDPSLAAMFPATDEPEVVARFEASLSELPPTERPARLAERPGGFGTGGDRTSLRLGDAEVALIRAVAAANPRTVVAIQAGSAVVCREWLDAVPAVVQAWYGGCEAGPGLADVTPTFPFGFGLSYTTFEVGAVSVAVDDEALRVTGEVRNTGERAGADVVQVYAQLPDPEAPDRLVGFARVEVPAGTAASFTIDVPRHRLATRDPAAHAWQPPRGPHRLLVARHAGEPGAAAIDVAL